MSSERKVIRQIIPALKGWVAVYEENDKSESSVPLICWAWVEVPGELTFGVPTEFVVGLDGGDYVDFCSDNANFLRYEYQEPAVSN